MIQPRRQQRMLRMGVAGDEDDVRWLRRILHKDKFRNRLHKAGGGTDLLIFHNNAKCPDKPGLRWDAGV